MRPHDSGTAAETISVMLAIFARIKPALRKSITFDNDTAFAQHGLLQSMRAIATWFCDAYASWQKGGVDSGAKRNRFKRSGFGRLCQAL
jgi:IS30 family transposase